MQQGTWRLWENQGVSLPTSLLQSVSMTSSAFGWVVGSDGTALRWDGNIWTDQGPTAGTKSVASVSPGVAWAVGWFYSLGYPKGKISRWNGSEWTTVSHKADPNPYNAIAMLSAENGWIVAGGGATYYLDGWDLIQVPSPASASLYSVSIVSPSDVWSVGEFGTILHWNGAYWAAMPSPVRAKLRSVDMVSGTDGWAVGPQVILRWNGLDWSKLDMPITEYLLCVSMSSSADGWAVGYGGAMLHWNGLEWVRVTGPTTEDLFSVFMVSATDGWAVGGGGTILRYSD